MKLTEKQSRMLDFMKKDFPNGSFAEEVNALHQDITIQSARVTLSSLVRNSVCTKNKEEFEGKEKTKYTLV